VPFGRRGRVQTGDSDCWANPWRVGITHTQFVLRDLTPDRPLPEDCDPWTPEAHASNVGLLPGELYVGTSDTLGIDVELSVHEARPDVDVTACVYATEASLDVPSGRISVDELMSEAGQRPVEVKPGTYRVLVRYVDETADDAVADRIALDLWLAPFEPVRVLKPG
jgi:hypothetical protein